MNTRNPGFQQMIALVAGQTLCVAVMLGIYALLGRFSAKVLLGGVAGMTLAVLNFLAMSVLAGLAADKAEQQDVPGGQKLIQLSYAGRLIGLFLLLVLCAKSGWFDLLALVLPLTFTRPILTVWELLGRRGERKE